MGAIDVGAEHTDEIGQLRSQVEELRGRLAEVEAHAVAAQQEAHHAREEVIRLREQVAAAERDQQDLKSVRARLTRMQLRGLLARVLNRR